MAKKMAGLGLYGHLMRWGFVGLFFVFWELSFRLGWIDPLFITGPIGSIVAMPAVVKMSGVHVYNTLYSFFVAFIASAIVGALLGFGIGSNRYLYRMFMPLLILGVSIPKVVLLPLFILWFGIGKLTIITYAALSGFFPMIINTMAAVQEVKPNQVLIAKAMGYNKLQIYRKVIFPSMLPVLTTGLFYACHSSMTGIFIMEMALARFGLGAMVYSLAVTFRTGELYAGVVLTASITIIINVALWSVARYFSKWRN
jgi:ABC-type nitrate/sulfonate/bicarbonate transport system permease component